MQMFVNNNNKKVLFIKYLNNVTMYGDQGEL